MDCELCSALQNDQYRTVYQDEHVFVLVNVEPIKDGHVMILPVRHVEQLGDLTPEEAKSFLGMIDQCMAMVVEKYDETPMCLVNGQRYRTQAHLHAHVLPSKKNLRGLYAASEGLEERVRADKDALERMAETLRLFFKKV